MAQPRTASSEMRLLAPAASLLIAGVALAFAAPQFHIAAETLRWIAILLIAAFALRRRTVTPWIFAAMLAGAEIGVDAPVFATHLRVFSDIFLRLIKTIVAPLILCTLITGIAGHGDLKSVGRMGIRQPHLLRGRNDVGPRSRTDRHQPDPCRSGTHAPRRPAF